MVEFIFYLLFWRTGADASAVIFEQMLGTSLDTSGAISVFTLRINFP